MNIWCKERQCDAKCSETERDKKYKEKSNRIVKTRFHCELPHVACVRIDFLIILIIIFTS